MSGRIYLNALPEKRHAIVLHIDAEEHCLSGLRSSGRPIFDPTSNATFQVPRQGSVGILMPHGSWGKFSEFLWQIVPSLASNGLSQEDVLVVTDCYRAGHSQCRGAANLTKDELAVIASGPFDVAVWDAAHCTLAHEQALVA